MKTTCAPFTFGLATCLVASILVVDAFTGIVSLHW